MHIHKQGGNFWFSFSIQTISAESQILTEMVKKVQTWSIFVLFVASQKPGLLIGGVQTSYSILLLLLTRKKGKFSFFDSAFNSLLVLKYRDPILSRIFLCLHLHEIQSKVFLEIRFFILKMLHQVHHTCRKRKREYFNVTVGLSECSLIIGCLCSFLWSKELLLLSSHSAGS